MCITIKNTLRGVEIFIPKTEKEKIAFQKVDFLRKKYLSVKLGSRVNGSWDYLTLKNKDSNLLKPYKDGEFFYNNLEYKKSYWKVFFRNFYLLFPGTFKKGSKVDLNKFIKKDEPKLISDNFKIQWIGHSSFFVQVNGQNILIDPVFSDFVSPCFKRYTKPGINLKDLPKIDTILISHNHVDHLDENTLKHFVKYQPTILVPLGLKKIIENLGFKNVIELNWFDEVFSKKDEKQINFTSTPAFHWSQPIFKSNKKVLKGNETLWCGWVIKANNKTLYHSGDTAKSNEVFQSINKKFNTLNYALLPIAPEDEEDMHMGIDSFFEATKVLKAKTVIPMHYLAFRMGAERVEDPYFAMLKKLKYQYIKNR
ncbi:MAG: hypothetical protein KR126chlam4_00705 [Candidatus Anoxychlamydiales bacterium]|nr:hypothetical protein [Candidatus Anoxychlamydiales bacterium]